MEVKKPSKKLSLTVAQIFLSLILVLGLIYIVSFYLNSVVLAGVVIYLIVGALSLFFLSITQLIYYFARKRGIRIPGLFSYLMKRMTKEEVDRVGIVKAIIYEQYLYNLDRIIYASFFFVVFIYYFIPNITGIPTVVGQMLVSLVFGIWLLSYMVFLNLNFRLMEIKLESLINPNDKHEFLTKINPDDFINFPEYTLEDST
ncbi:MAG: hypothetical protein ACYCS1_04340 [Gammaproteobacteria bacterium]